MRIPPPVSRFLSLLALAVATLASASPVEAPKVLDAHLEKTSFQYLMYEPAPSRTAKLPVIVYLHGTEVPGSDANALRKKGLPRVLEGSPSFPFIVVAPMCPGDQGSCVIEAIDAVLDDVLRMPQADARRVYLVGGDVGARSALYLAYRQPSRFAAVVAAGAISPAPGWAPRLSRVPIWYMHGAQDPMTPIEAAETFVDAVRGAGGEIKFTRFEHHGHSLTDVLEDATLYRWLRQFRQPDRNVL